MEKYTGPDGFERDLDAEMRNFPSWTFAAVIGGSPAPPDPKIKPDYVAKAYKSGTTHEIHAYGDTRVEARAKLLDKMTHRVMPADR